MYIYICIIYIPVYTYIPEDDVVFLSKTHSLTTLPRTSEMNAGFFFYQLAKRKWRPITCRRHITVAIKHRIRCVVFRVSISKNLSTTVLWNQRATLTAVKNVLFLPEINEWITWRFREFWSYAEFGETWKSSKMWYSLPWFNLVVSMFNKLRKYFRSLYITKIIINHHVVDKNIKLHISCLRKNISLVLNISLLLQV